MFLKILGYALIAFGIADFALFQFGVADLTGVSWSPIAAGAAGAVLLRFSSRK